MNPSSHPAASNTVEALTAIRFFAALAVVLFHYAKHAVRELPEEIRNFVQNGSAGVTLFFILSGFILVYVYERRNEDGHVDLRAFWVRRFARIYPVYFLAWIIAGCILYLQWIQAGEYSWLVKATLFYGSLSISLLQAWVPSAAQAWNGPGWSLSVEAFFYALFPLLLFSIRRCPDNGLWPLFAISGVFYFLTALAAATVANTVPVLAQGSPIAAATVDYFGNFPPAHLATFLMGIVAGRICVRRQSPAAMLSNRRSAGLALTLAVVGLLSISPGAYPLLWRLALAVAFALLILVLALPRDFNARAGMPTGVFRTKVFSTLVLLGQASYATYILQSPLWEVFCLALGVDPSPRKEAPFVLTYVLLLLAVSVAVYRAYERPLEAWIKRRFLGDKYHSDASGETTGTHQKNSA